MFFTNINKLSCRVILVFGISSSRGRIFATVYFVVAQDEASSNRIKLVTVQNLDMRL
jgi:hypothetical protein